MSIKILSDILLSKPQFSHALYTFMICAVLSWCKPNTEQNNHVPYQMEQTEWIQSISSPREYTIYTKKINSIVGVKSHLTKAQEKVKNNAVLSTILWSDNMSIYTLLPKILKESVMDHTRTSHSGAQWYMQLTERAIDEIYRIYPKIKTQNLKISDPIDNIILWALYRELTHKDISSFLKSNNISFSKEEIELTMVLSYNIWPSRAKKLLQKYNPTTFDDFIKRIIKENKLSYDPKDSYDKTYKVTYNNMFWSQEFTKENSREKNKLKEWIRYVYVISALVNELKTPKNITIINTIDITPNNTLYNQIKKLREQWVFRSDANINDICRLILESNGFLSTEIPNNEKIPIITDVVKEFLP